MNKTLLKCAIVGGIIMFLVSLVFWRAAFWHGEIMGTFQNQREVAEVIRKNVYENGVYVMPGLTTSDERAQGLPLVVMGVRFEGARPTSFYFAGRVIIKIIAAFIATWILLKTNIRKYTKRVGFFVAIGILIAISAHLSFWLKGYHTVGYTLFSMIGVLVQWFVAGLVISKMIKKT